MTTVSTTATIITQKRKVARGPVSTRTYIPAAVPCASVFSLPPLLAGITACRMTQNRISVMPSSRARITPVIHHGRSPRTDSETSAAPMIALSAIGSAIFPKSVTRLYARAR